jgi:hypothetical protein
LTVNANIGRYYQLPAFTTLGFKDISGELINKKNGIVYIRADHLVAGADYMINNDTKFSVEGFYKKYSNYPFSVSDSVSISSKGADFGSFGDEEVKSLSKGKAFGMEILLQSKNLLGMNVIVAYTLVRSDATDYKYDYIPTAWDNRHILNITALRSLKRNWEIGLKWRFVGGPPYTPWDIEKSTLASAWDAQGRAYLDYSRFNKLRLHPFHQLDVRVDKEYFFNHWSLRFYLDIQNVYNYKSDEPDKILREENSDGIPLPAEGSPLRYPLKTVKSSGSGTILPTVGVIIEF